LLTQPPGMIVNGDQTKRPGRRMHVREAVAAFVLSSAIPGGFAAEKQPVDVSKLPPPASGTVDFLRDIEPILETSCLRCHGPKKPKGNFRLDTREAALKGGEIGVAILPGNSAGSPLIHYV